MISCGSSSVPCATAANAPIPRRLDLLAALDARGEAELGGELPRPLAERVGVISLAGAFWRSRAALAASRDHARASTAADTSSWAETQSRSSRRRVVGRRGL